jgi:hypothetical protein
LWGEKTYYRMKGAYRLTLLLRLRGNASSRVGRVDHVKLWVRVVWEVLKAWMLTHQHFKRKCSGTKMPSKGSGVRQVGPE